MKEYVIRVVETLSKGVIIKADSLDDAMSKANDLYQDGKINLDYDDFNDVDFEEAITSLDTAKELLYSEY